MITGSNMKTQQQVVQDLAGLLANFQNREYSGVIGPQTLFFSDLGFVSIDAIVLGETLEQHYGQSLPFQQFLAQAAERGAEDLSVGELAAFLAEHLR